MDPKMVDEIVLIHTGVDGKTAKEKIPNIPPGSNPYKVVAVVWKRIQDKVKIIVAQVEAGKDW